MHRKSSHQEMHSGHVITGEKPLDCFQVHFSDVTGGIVAGCFITASVLTDGNSA
jgi:hypothetical protein